MKLPSPEGCGWIDYAHGSLATRRIGSNIARSKCSAFPSNASPARISPITLANVKPWPDKPAALTTRSCAGCFPITKCSSGEFVKRHVFIASGATGGIRMHRCIADRSRFSRLPR